MQTRGRAAAPNNSCEIETRICRADAARYEFSFLCQTLGALGFSFYVTIGNSPGAESLVGAVSLSEVGHLTTPPAQLRDPADRGTTAEAHDAALAISAELAAELAAQFPALDLFERLAAIRARIAGRLVFTTSFGLEDQAIAHALLSQKLAIEVATLDTGRLFPETHDVWAATERRYGTRIAAFAPDHASVKSLIARQGSDGMRFSVAARLECCSVRKVAPLARALTGCAAWITGIRAGQSAERARFAPVSFDEARRLIKVNPLFDWTREATLDFVRAHQVPYNTLHDRGFLSIGCAPCTRALAPGEPERAGRWWWEQEEKKECGLHITADGRVSRAASPHA
jgi:phosphoadenosine phosphosulfate reductase